MTPEEIVAQALRADEWTEPRASHPHPVFHKQFNAGQVTRASALAVAALREEGYRIVRQRETECLQHFVCEGRRGDCGIVWLDVEDDGPVVEG